MKFDPDLVDNSAGALETLVSSYDDHTPNGTRRTDGRLDPRGHVHRTPPGPTGTLAGHEEGTRDQRRQGRSEAADRGKPGSHAGNGELNRKKKQKRLSQLDARLMIFVNSLEVFHSSNLAAAEKGRL